MSSLTVAPMAGPGERTPRHDRAWRLRVLGLAFALFSTARLVAYLPTVHAILATGRTDQHSLWTWSTWAAANGVMALWLYEQAGQKLDRAIVINACNAAMCTITSALIVFFRLH